VSDALRAGGEDDLLRYFAFSLGVRVGIEVDR
jgi:hypothetical protein